MSRLLSPVSASYIGALVITGAVWFGVFGVLT